MYHNSVGAKLGQGIWHSFLILTPGIPDSTQISDQNLEWILKLRDMSLKSFCAVLNAVGFDPMILNTRQ